MPFTAQQPDPKMGGNRQFATFRAVFALMIREMATRHGRSPGGYAWALLEPLGGIIILSLGMAIIIRTPPLGNSFILFFATGFLPFQIYQNLSNTVSRSISFSRALLFYPSVTWIDAVIARFILNALTDVLAMLIVMTGILSIADTTALLNLGPILTSIGLALLTGLSLGMLNCVIFGLFPVWMQVWSIVTRPLFLVSGVLFIYDDMPPIAQNILWYNPLIHITGLMRQGFYPTYRGDYISVPYVAGIALVCLFLGVVLMGRHHRNILNSG